MRSLLLAVYHRYIVISQEVYEVAQCNFGCIRHSGKHRLAIEHLSYAYAVSTTYKLPIQPQLG